METVLKRVMDSAFPLFDLFREKAPGTLKHSQNVANICESIAIELALDVDLMKCSAMYHDIGKINFPEYFSENQDTNNPHDDLDPMASYHIITRHVGDGILILLNIDEIPIEMINIISQHHGNTVLRHFFEKSGYKIDDKWRYKCRVPETTEAAILMIVDSIEATSKSMYNNGEMKDGDERRSLIRATIERLVDDGQLDNLTIGVLKIVKRILVKELDTIYHKREVYIDDKKLKDVTKEEKDKL